MQINILKSPSYIRAVKLAQDCCFIGYEAEVAGFSLCQRAAEIAETSPYLYSQVFDMLFDLANRGWFYFTPLAELPGKATVADLRRALENANLVSKGNGHFNFSAEFIRRDLWERG